MRNGIQLKHEMANCRFCNLILETFGRYLGHYILDMFIWAPASTHESAPLRGTTSLHSPVCQKFDFSCVIGRDASIALSHGKIQASHMIACLSTVQGSVEL